jgi:DUF971 family protein
MERIGEDFLAIVWDDGHETFLEVQQLRKSCPCAGCRSEAHAPRPPLKSSGGALALLPDVPRLVGIDEVGHYAVRLRWSDGHSSGLYDHRLLRSLCPCEVCRRGAPMPPGGGPK